MIDERAIDAVGGSRRPPFMMWVLVPATLGFVAGFLGPVILNREANQGPLLGIFITGPGGAILGLVLGVTARLLRLPASIQWQVLVGASAALVIWTLTASLPEPRLIGYVVDGEFRGCASPSQSLERAMNHWERRLAGTQARPAWQADARASAAIDLGVVLELTVARRFGIYEQRKPWNRGQLMARARPTPRPSERYYAQYAGGSCDAYPTGTRAMYYASSSSSPSGPGPREWPPTSDIAAFLGLKVLVPAPDKYLRLVQDRVDR